MGRRDYRNDKHGRQHYGIPPGDYTLNTHLVPVEVIRPRFKEGPLVFRPWPHKDFDRPDELLQPGRDNENAYGQSQWIIRVDAAVYVGIQEGGQPCTFLLYEPTVSHDIVAQNPYLIFYRATKRAYTAGKFDDGHGWEASWNRLFASSDDKYAAIKRPGSLWFVQGHVFVNGDTVYVGEDTDRTLPLGLEPDDPLPVIQLARTAGDNLVELLDTPADNPPKSDDIHSRFKYGSAVGRFHPEKRVLRGGLFVTIYNPRKLKTQFAHTSYEPTAKAAKDKSRFQAYEAALTTKYEVRIGSQTVTFEPAMSREQVNMIFRKGQFWLGDGDSPGLLRFAPYEEQALWIARAFAPVPKLVRFAFADHPEYLTAEVKAVLNRQVSATVNPPDALPEEPEMGVETDMERKQKLDKGIRQQLDAAFAKVRAADEEDWDAGPLTEEEEPDDEDFGSDDDYEDEEDDYEEDDYDEDGEEDEEEDDYDEDEEDDEDDEEEDEEDEEEDEEDEEEDDIPVEEEDEDDLPPPPPPPGRKKKSTPAAPSVPDYFEEKPTKKSSSSTRPPGKPPAKTKNPPSNPSSPKRKKSR